MADENFYADVVNGSVPVGYYDEINSTYLRVLKQLLPPGAAWNLGPGGNFEKLLEALGHSYERVILRARDLGFEFDPETMFELLTDWERVFSLPGTNPSPPTTLDGRRDAVAGKMLGHGDPSIPNFEALALGAGYDAVIVNVRQKLGPFVAGSVVGDALWNSEGGWPFAWLVITESGADDPLLQWLLESVSPDHTFPIFVFESSPVYSEPFETWTGDDPDNWTVSESGTPAGEITQVGSGEGYGGTGTGAMNMKLDDPAGGVASIIDLTGQAVVADEWYALMLDISYADGGPLLLTDFGGGFVEQVTAEVGVYVYLFQAASSTINLALGLDTNSIPGGVGDVTIDRIRLFGPIF